MTAAITVLLVILAIALAATAWRFASRRRSLPCPVWLRWLVELDNPFTRTNRAAFIVETLALSEGMTVLDAGCGPGRLTVPLARGVGPTGRVVALDLQPGMLARAKTRTDAAGCTNVEFVEAALGEGRLPADHFERGVLVTVLGEVPDRAAALAELFRALKPGGILAIAELVFDPHFQSRKTVTGLAASAGFRERAFFGRRWAYVIHFEKPDRESRGHGKRRGASSETTLPADRPISQAEAAVVEWVLVNRAPEKPLDHLLAQVPHLRVVARCACGCASIDFAEEGQSQEAHPVAEATASDSQGRKCGVIVWELRGRVSGLEVYELDPGSATELPTIDALSRET
jgi:SAM-dependent methyltransferase